MKSYTLGNKGTCIIRSYSSGMVGSVDQKYANQPYTIIKDIEASVYFNSHDSDSKIIQKELSYNINNLDYVRLSNINLNDKILNLIYSKKEEVFVHYIEKPYSDEAGRIFLSHPYEKYQVFIYNEDEQLENAYDRVMENFIPVNNVNSPYLVVYSCLASKGYKLQKPHHMYLTLDLQVVGNDELDNQTTYWLHFEKCSLKTTQDLYFKNGVNTVDLEFQIIHSDEDYIAIE